MMKILNKYKFEYSNGVVQYKNLISNVHFKEIITPAKLEIELLKTAKDFGSASKIKKELIDTFGEFWFTNNSPLYRAIHTGVLEPLFNGMKPVPIKITRIEI
jgi:hypothetical protein